MATLLERVNWDFIGSSVGIIQVAQMVLCLTAFFCVQFPCRIARPQEDFVCPPIPNDDAATAFLSVNMAVVIGTIVVYAVFVFEIDKKMKIRKGNLINSILGCGATIILFIAIVCLTSNEGVYKQDLAGLTAGLLIDVLAFLNATGYAYFSITNIDTTRHQQEKFDHDAAIAAPSDSGHVFFTGDLNADEGDFAKLDDGEPILSSMRNLASSRSLDDMDDCYEYDVDLRAGGVSKRTTIVSVCDRSGRGSEFGSSDSSLSFKNAVELVINELTPDQC